MQWLPLQHIYWKWEQMLFAKLVLSARHILTQLGYWFDSISFISWTTTTTTAKKSAKHKKNNTFNQTGFTAHWSFIHACIIPTIELVESGICSREICWLRTRASFHWIDAQTISENALFTVEHKFVDLFKSHSINGYQSTTTTIPVNIKHTIKPM